MMELGYEMKPTRNGRNFYEVTSAMQNAIRKGDYEVAGYAMWELLPEYLGYLRKRLLVISAEDCFGVITKEILALCDIGTEDAMEKALALICLAKKNRDADYFVCNLMYNDVPTSPSNPFPGQLYNHPGDDVPDVYEGVIVDYEGEKVNPEILLKVLTGDESAGGKVLKTTKEDNVFLFFSDHGGPDVLCLPGGRLHSADLLEALKTMNQKEMYNKFVLYIEACYSGSMFLNLPEDLKIVAVTAANDQESSWGWYCGDESVVKGTNRHESIGESCHLES